MLLTFSVVAFCLLVKRHYTSINKKLVETDKVLVSSPLKKRDDIPEFDTEAKTAVFFINKSRGVGIHTILWVLRLFPKIFKNFIFITVGEVDVESYGGEKNLKFMQDKVDMLLNYFSRYAASLGFPTKTYSAFGTQPVDEAVKLALKICKANPNCVFFASQLVLKKDTWILRQLHNNTAFDIQRRLHLTGEKMMILPMKL